MFHLIYVLSKPGQILSGLPLVELAMAHLQHRRRHVASDLIVHFPYDMLAQNALYRYKHLHQNHTKHIQQSPEQKSPEIPSHQFLQGFHQGQAPVRGQPRIYKQQENNQAAQLPKLLDIVEHATTSFHQSSPIAAICPPGRLLAAALPP